MVFIMFICPICKSELYKADNSYKCENKHSYDISSSGYVNLLNPGKMNNAKAGDSKEMVRARTSFFECGAYEKISDELCNIISSLQNNTIIDAGCGEGYYTHNIALTLPNSHVIGFDMTKFGCEHGAKTAKRHQLGNLFYAVGNIFDLPVKENFADVVINVFAPVADAEFLRVLKPGGHLIVVSAGRKHLDGLKAILYKDVYLNEEKILSYDGFKLLETKNLCYSAHIVGNDVIKNLFTMTPYYHRTSLEDKKKLDDISELNTTVEVNFSIYTKL